MCVYIYGNINVDVCVYIYIFFFSLIPNEELVKVEPASSSSNLAHAGVSLCWRLRWVRSFHVSYREISYIS